MKGRFFLVLTLIFCLLVGFAAANTVLDITGSLNVAENLEDFKIEITNLKINNSDKKDLISNDKQSFTFTGSGNDTLEYTVTNYSYQYDASIVLTCIPSDNITVEQINNLPAQSKNSKVITSTNTNEITCTINVEKISRTDYAEDMCKYVEGTVWTFDYTGAEQEFTVPCDGNYKIEAWGAQGGDIDPIVRNEYSSILINIYGGYGGYSTGNIILKDSKKLFVNIGGQGQLATYINSNPRGGYNGGGGGGLGNISYWINYRLKSAALSSAGGGGATHIATESGVLNTLKNKKDKIIIVAGGGGGATPAYVYSGHGGGISGTEGYVNSGATTKGATQTSGYDFGLGQNGHNSIQATTGDAEGSGGGGGGWYGGLSYQGTETNSDAAGSGGSGFIGNSALTSKLMYCYNCTESSDESTKTISTTCTSSTPTANCAKQGNGYAKITYLGK